MQTKLNIVKPLDGVPRNCRAPTAQAKINAPERPGFEPLGAMKESKSVKAKSTSRTVFRAPSLMFNLLLLGMPSFMNSTRKIVSCHSNVKESVSQFVRRRDRGHERGYTHRGV